MSEKNQNDIEILAIEASYCSTMIGRFTPVFDNFEKEIILAFFRNAEFINQVLIPISEPSEPGRKSYRGKPPAELLSGYFTKSTSELGRNIAARLNRNHFNSKDFEEQFPLSTNGGANYKKQAIAFHFYYDYLKPAMTECADYLAGSLGEALNSLGDHNEYCWLMEDTDVNHYGAAAFLSERLQEYGVTLSGRKIKDTFSYARRFRNHYIHGSNVNSFPGFHQKWADKYNNYEWNYGMQKIQEVFQEIAVTDRLKSAFQDYQNEILKISRYTNYHPIPVSEIATNEIEMTYFLAVANRTDGKLIKSRQYFFYDSENQLREDIEKDKVANEAARNKTSIADLAAEHGIPENKVTEIINMPVTDDGYVHVNRKTAESAITAYLKSEAYTLDQITGNHDVPLLDKLASYHGGPLEKPLLKELFRTHKIILDSSMFLNKNARNYLRSDFLSLVQDLKNEDIVPDIVVTKDTKNELYQGYQEYRSDHEKGFDENRGFTLLHDLETSHLIRSAGILDTDETKAESIEYLLSDDPSQRAAVIMTGDSGWTKELNQAVNPLLTVCRFYTDPLHNAHFTLLRNWYPLKEQSDLLSDADDEDFAEEKEIPEEKETSQVSTGTHGSLSEDVTPEPAPVSSRNENYQTKRKLNFQFYRPQKANVQKSEEIRKPDSSVLLSSDQNLMHDEEGTAVHITGALLEDGTEAEGGEGKIFLTDQKHVVAKIYRDKKKAADVQKKLTDMVAMHVHIPGVCWPQHLLYDNHGEFAGFLMEQVPEGSYTIQKSVWHLDHADVREKILPEWDRLSSIKLCARISRIFSKLHEKGILMGDVNPGNIMINPHNPEDVHFVDCDSYQFRDYLCPVGVEEYSGPEFLTRATIDGKVRFDQTPRDVHDEDYAMAYILFHIMMQCSPFYEVKMDEQAAWKKAHRFSFDDKQPPKGLITSVRYVMWKNMTREVRDCFADTFKKNIDVSASRYGKAFNRYAYAMVHYNQPRDLMYDLFIDYTNDHSGTIDLTCQRCGKAFNLEKTPQNEKLKNEGKKNVVRFCRHCNEELNAYHNIPQTVKCARCGKEFTTTMYQVEIRRLNHKKLYCQDCLDKFSKYKANRKNNHH